jgi:hypothetical protein
MADDIKPMLPDAAVAASWDEEEDKDRWPVPYAAMLVTASSAVLWALIVAGVRWLVG